jgi:hypothetical protein
MRKVLLTLLPLLLFGTGSLLAQKSDKTCKLTVNWKFEGVIDGYDHDNKMVLYVDGEEVGESTVKKETEPNSHVFLVPKGQHDIKIVNYAMYEGEWEEHSVENKYSLDCMFEENLTLKKKCTIDLEFDITNEETKSMVKN